MPEGDNGGGGVRRPRVHRWLWLTVVGLASAALLALAWVVVAATIQEYGDTHLPLLSAGTLGDRILVIAPHPDDEALGAAGIVTDALASGKQVRVVLMTCGDGYRRIVQHEVPRRRPGDPPIYQMLGRIRVGESREAMRRLGLPPGDLLFLGYQETGLAALWSAPWHRALRGANEADRVPYGFAFHPGAPYDAADVVADLRSLVASFAPTAVVFPSARDENTDHWATSAFVQHALDAADYRGVRLEYLVHRGMFPFPWAYLPRNPLLPPKELAGAGTWLSYPLEGRTEDRKHDSIDAYRSQRRVMEPYLLSFVRRNELFCQTPPARVSVVTSLPVTDGFPGVVAGDAGGIVIARFLEAEADITGVSAVSVKGRVWVGMRVRGPLGRYVGYRIGVHAFGAGTEERFDAEVVGARVTARSDDATVALSARDVVRGRDRVWVAVPAGLLPAASTLMVGGETVSGGLVVDRTAWRTVRLR